jgi:hypothetical protein
MPPPKPMPKPKPGSTFLDLSSTSVFVSKVMLFDASSNSGVPRL